ncbi:hypothetical protein [Miniphocaeibacter massiliensis]|uniref:hypothetical protein n=1 Tax=Miniphocaeibacter massiliensis TaxID=2041841 RepID=UPI000C1BB076|nr:hypothetical protein [Miniphocaeibacter massiliensis]
MENIKQQNNITTFPGISQEEIYQWKIEKLEAELQLAKEQKEKAELQLKLKEVPPLLNEVGLSNWLDITPFAAQTLLKTKGFPMINVGGKKAITSKVIEWLENNVE